MTKLIGSNLKLSFFKSVYSFFFTQAFFSISLLIVGILTARILGPEGRGIYSLFFTYVGFGISFLNFGISQSNIFFYKNYDKQSLLGNTIFAFIISVLMAGVSAFFLDCMNVFNLPVSLLIICFSATLLHTYITGLYLGGGYISQYNRTQALHGAILLLATFVLIPFPNLVEYSVGIRVGGTVLVAVTFTLYLVSLAKIKQLKVNVSLLQSQARFGFKNWAQNLLGQFNYRIYPIALAFTLDDSAIGIYSVALLTIETIRFAPDALCTLLFPELMSMNNQSTKNHATAQMLRIILVITVFLGSFVFIITPKIIPMVFGEDYSSAVPLVRLMMVGVIVGASYQTLTRFFSAINKQTYSIISGSVGALFGIITLFIFMPLYGILGAAISFSVTQSAVGISTLLIFKLYTKMQFKDILSLSFDDFKFSK